LLQDKGLRSAIESLLAHLEGDYSRSGLRACAECSTCLDRRTAVYLHAQLRSSCDALRSVRDLLEKLPEAETL
jgi:hypothetical protein